MRNKVVEYLINSCIEATRKRVLILYDNTTEELIPLFHRALLKNGKVPEVFKLEVACCHGEEPSIQCRNKMLYSDAVICLTQYSLAHTEARNKANERGITFLSMPEYSLELLDNPAFLVDYSDKLPQVQRYTDVLTIGKKAEIRTMNGSKLYLNMEGRKGNCCPGISNTDFLLGSPPDIEANIAPVENGTNGQLIVNGSVTDRRIGLLKFPVILNVEQGAVTKITSKNKYIEKIVRSIFMDINSKNAYIIGEFGIGFNDCADLCGNMLVDEGAKGCIHFGIGSNWTIGGKNKVDFHLDFVIKDATVLIDNKVIIEEGKLIYVE